MTDSKTDTPQDGPKPWLDRWCPEAEACTGIVSVDGYEVVIMNAKGNGIAFPYCDAMDVLLSAPVTHARLKLLEAEFERLRDLACALCNEIGVGAVVGNTIDAICVPGSPALKAYYRIRSASFLLRCELAKSEKEEDDV